MFTEKLKKILDRFRFLEIRLQGQLERSELEDFSKEYSDLKEVTELIEKFFNVENEIKLTKDLLEDSELVQLAQNEINSLENQKINLENQLRLLLLPKDADDDRSVIIEIRAGTGGDEASLFALDLFRMYTRFSDDKKWKTEIIEQSYTGGTAFYENQWDKAPDIIYGSWPNRLVLYNGKRNHAACHDLTYEKRYMLILFFNLGK